MKLVSVALLVVVGVHWALAGQDDSLMVQRVSAARQAVSRQDWKSALSPLQILVAHAPRNGEFRLMLARARRQTGDLAGAEADYRIALTLKAADPAILSYNIAQCNALLKRPVDALTWLRKAISLGYRRLESARDDAAFESLRADSEYRELVGLVGLDAISRDEGWSHDIRYLTSWIERRSFHPFRTETSDRYLSAALYTRAEVDAKVQKLLADIPSLSDRAIEVELFRLVAALGDGHTEIEGSKKRLEYALTLPLGFYVFDEGLFVVSASPAHSDLLGAKVQALDGLPTAEALARIDPLISRDNAMWTKAMEPHYLRHLPFLKELGISKAEEKVTLTLRLADGHERTVPLAADPRDPDIWNALPKPPGWRWIGDNSSADFQRGNDKPYWLKWNPRTGILYVQYNKIVNDERQTLEQFAGTLTSALAKYPVAKLVIDMRNNNGGDTYLNEPLLRTIAGNSKANQPGHLFVIIGRRTFSAAMNAVSYFGKYTQAIFVGEPTGGKPNSPGDENFFSLPYSGILVNLSDRYWQGSWPDDFSDWRAPDIEVAVTFKDCAAGRDAAMEIIAAQK